MVCFTAEKEVAMQRMLDHNVVRVIAHDLAPTHDDNRVLQRAALELLSSLGITAP